MKNYIITAALIYRGEKIMLIDHGPEFGSNNYWCLPGGTVDSTETALDGMLREVKEETGLTPHGDVHVAFLTQHMNLRKGWQSVVPTYEFSVHESDKVNINDPDKETFSAKFFTVEEAIKKLENNPFQIMSEPLIDYLKTGKGKMWTYEEKETGISLLYSHNFK